MKINAIYQFGSSVRKPHQARDIDVAFVVGDSAAADALVLQLRARCPHDGLCRAGAYASTQISAPLRHAPPIHWVVITERELEALPIGIAVRDGVCLWRRAA